MHTSTHTNQGAQASPGILAYILVCIVKCQYLNFYHEYIFYVDQLMQMMGAVAEWVRASTGRSMVRVPLR